MRARSPTLPDLRGQIDAILRCCCDGGYGDSRKYLGPAIATAVRNLQKSNALQDIPALHLDNLPHLLSFNWCFDPVYSGTSKKADAIHIAIFLKSSTGAIKTVRNIEDLRAIGETMKLTYKTITMENEDTDFQFTTVSSRAQLIRYSRAQKVAQSATCTSIFFRARSTSCTRSGRSYSSPKSTSMLRSKTFIPLTRPLLISTQPTGSTCTTIAIRKRSPRKKELSARTAPRPATTTAHHSTESGTTPTAMFETARTETATRNYVETRAHPSTKKQTAASHVANPHHRAKAQPRHLSCPQTSASATFSIKRTRSHPSSRVLASPARGNHNPYLRNGKLEEADKKAVRANLQLIEGKFAALAMQQLDTLLF